MYHSYRRPRRLKKGYKIALALLGLCALGVAVRLLWPESVTEAIKNGTPPDGILANCFFEKNNRLIRSSTLLIREESDAIAGAVCINTDASQAAAALDFLSRQLLGSAKAADFTAQRLEPPESKAPKKTDKSVQDFVEDLI